MTRRSLCHKLLTLKQRIRKEVLRVRVSVELRINKSQIIKKKAKETYKQAGKHILFWVVYWPFVILVLIGLFGHQRQIGVRDVVVIEATMQTAG